MNSVEQFYGIIKYLTAVFYLLLCIGLFGISILQICGLRRKLTQSDAFLISPIIGIASYSSLLLLIAANEIGISYAVVWALYITFVGLGLLSWITENKGQSIPKVIEFGREVPVLILKITGIASVGLLPYLFLFLKKGFPTGLGTSITWTNNDLGVYLQMATNVAATGVRDAGLITGWNAGLQASFDHPAIHPFFAAVSRLMLKDPYQIGIVLISLFVAAIFIASVLVIKNFKSDQMKLSVLMISAVVVVNPPIISAVANFFLPQILSVGLALAFFGLTLSIMKSSEEITLINTVPLAVISVAVFFTSTEIGMVLIPLFSIVAFLKSGVKIQFGVVKKIFAVHIIGFGLLLLMDFNLVSNQLEVFSQMSTAGVAGWKSNFVSLSMVMGLVPLEFGGPYSSGTRLLDFILILSFACLILILVRRKNSEVSAVLFLLLICGLVVVAVDRWGIDGYQTWKFVTTMTPVVFLLLIVIFHRALDGIRPLNLFPILAITLGTSMVWSSQIWAQTGETSYVNSELIQITHLKESQEQTALNILVAPYFETMAASVMTGVPTHLASPSYFFFNGQPLLFRCTLAAKSQMDKIQNPGKIIAERGNYVLIGTPACDEVVTRP